MAGRGYGERLMDRRFLIAGAAFALIVAACATAASDRDEVRRVLGMEES